MEMKTLAALLFVSLAAHGQAPKPHIVPVSLAVSLPAPAITTVREVHLPDWNGTAKMFTPKPQVVFMDETLERVARREGYERLGFKLYRRIPR
jgi:phage tail protein X